MKKTKMKLGFVFALMTILIMVLLIDPDKKSAQNLFSIRIKADQMHVAAEQEKENPTKRWELEFKQLRDPVTNKIPIGIKRNEQIFIKEQNAQFRRENRASSVAGDAAQTNASPFVNRGPFNIGGRTRALGIDVLDENIIIAGGISGGVWRTTDQGQSWTRTSELDQQPAVSTLVQDKREGKTNNWYYGTGERRGNSVNADGAFYFGNGIYKSTDNGQSWTLIPSTAVSGTSGTDVITSVGNFTLVDQIAIDYSNTTQEEIYVAGLGRIRRTDDDFQTWTTVLGSSNSVSNMADVVVTNSGVVFASVGNFSSNGSGGQEGVWRSADGVNWTDITPVSGLESSYLRLELSIDPSDDSKIWMLGDESLFVWDDDTQTWSDLSDNLNLPTGDRDVREDFDTQTYYDQLITVHPNSSDKVFIGGTNLYRSDDAFITGGQTQIGGYDPTFAGGGGYPEYPGHHPDIHSMDFFASDENSALVGSDGGVHITTNLMDEGTKPVDWTSLNNGYLSTQFYHAAINEMDYGDALVIGGMQDNGTWGTDNFNATSDWIELGGGDGSWAGLTYNSLYVSSQNGFVDRFESVDGVFQSPVEITPISGGEDDEFLFINPYTLNAVNPDQMVIGGRGRAFFTNDVRTNPGAGEWFEISSSDLTSSDANVTAMAWSVEPEGVLYIGTEVGNVIRVDNTQEITGDVTGTDLPFGDMPDGYIGAIAVDPTDAEHVFVTFTNYNVISLWESTDGGQTWSSISGNLEENANGSGSGPSIRAFAVMPDGNGGNYYFAGTTVGLFMTQTLDGDNTVWSQQSVDVIGNVVVSWVAVRPVEGFVAVSTHANGIFTGTYDVGINAFTNYSFDDSQKEYTLRANRSFDGNQPMGYRWERNGETIEGEETSSLIVTDAGSYRARLFFSQNESALSNPINIDIDGTAPEVSSIARFDPADEDTEGTTVVFQVTFSENVFNLGAEDFQTSGNASGTISSVEEITASTVFNVTVADIVGSGTLGLTIAESNDIIDESGNEFNGVIQSSESYNIVDGDVPTAAITRLDPVSEVTDQNEVAFQLAFNEKVVNFGPSDLVFAEGSVGAQFGNIREITEGVSYEVNIIEIEEDGTIGIAFSSTQDIEDESGNPFEGDITTNETYTIENIITSIDERYLGNHASIVVDRNPSDGIFYLAFPDYFSGDFDLGVINNTGRLIQQEFVQGYSAGTQFRLDLTTESDGIYIVKAQNEQNELTIKLLKRRD